ncbi:MAG: flagellar hook-basal body complex protein FliE [Desulfovibrionaceae bacterium]|nr:flagellar hook-basal body complex protein FliE [Desulfovibrionaceae bacterium]
MSIQQLGLNAYNTAIRNFAKAERAAAAEQIQQVRPQVNTFSDTLRNSLTEVNNLHVHKDKMIQAFASGETQNVHELMISLQKAGLAMNLTAAVRNKVMEAYKELSRVQF